MSNDFNRRPIIVMDFETTGIDPIIHDTIEIGALSVDHDALKIHHTFERKIKIQNPDTVQQAALDVNGYTPDRWRNAGELADVLAEFTAWCYDGIFCAWNITFEYRFLSEAFRRTGLINPFIERRYSHHLDLPSMAWYAFGGKLESLGYEAVTKTLGLPPEMKPHQAIMGAFHNLEVMRALRERMQ
jgi:DNA polymerase III alpha subunit (gram-positive type)